MNLRVLAGAALAYCYNHWLSNLPSHWMRRIYLRAYLKRIGKQTWVQMGCQFLNGRKVSLGDNSVVNFGCLIDGRQFQAQIGNNVSIGPEATILTLGHDPQASDFEDRGGDVVIGDRAWIAYQALILPGVTIGDGAVVAARAVVTKDVEPYTIVAGNPAKPIGKRNESLEYQLNFRPFLL